jgi:hypothetical protein
MQAILSLHIRKCHCVYSNCRQAQCKNKPYAIAGRRYNPLVHGLLIPMVKIRGCFADFRHKKSDRLHSSIIPL